MNVACEQALLFGRAKRVSGERASERQRKHRRACSQAKMNILSITLQVTPPMSPGRVATFQWNITGFEEQSNYVGRAVGIKSLLFAGQFRAIIVPKMSTAGNTGFSLKTQNGSRVPQPKVNILSTVKFCKI